MNFTIHLLSDIHVGDSIVYEKKKALIETLKKNVAEEKNSIIVIAGDLTHNGYGKASFLCFSCCLCLNTCCSSPNHNSSKTDELATFLTDIYRPLKDIGAPVLLCHGNHDESSNNMSYPVLDFIRSEFDANEDGCYCRVLHQVCFVVLGKYPGKEELRFLDEIHAITMGKYPYILIFHYQVSVGGDYDFWDINEKMAFMDNIKNKNVLCILHGHIHMTFANKLPTTISFCGSGDSSYMKIEIADQNIRSSEVAL
jgi:DNA repair exonuclease SbcCD nuclease subunit